MWDDNLWGKIDNIDERRKIARLASLACFEIKPDMNDPLAERFKDIQVSNYYLGKVTDKQNKILCGFYNTEFTDFLPLNQDGDAFNFLEFYFHNAGKEVIDAINEAKQKLADFDETPLYSLITSCEHAYDNYLPFKEWTYIPYENDTYEIIADLFDKTVEESGMNIEQNLEQIWICDISSFSSFQLAELIFLKGNKREKNYALFTLNADKNVLDLYFTLTGRSDVIYNVWAEKEGFFLNQNNFLAYLKFFCWEIEADDGKFLLPENIWEIPWKKELPPKDNWDKIHIEFKKPNPYHNKDVDIIWGEKDILKAKGMVVYANAFFTAWFGIDDTTGVVNMPNDEPLLVIAEQNIAPLKFKIPVSISLNKLDEKSEQKKDYPEGLERIKNTDIKDALTKKDFKKNFEDKITISEKRIIDVLVIDDYTFEQCRTVLIEGCWFDKDVYLSSNNLHACITFRNCVFATKFSAKDSHVSKSLIFESCVFNDVYNKPKEKQGIVVNLENFKSDGDLIFRNSRIYGEVSATTMKIYGNLFFQECLMAHSSFKKRFNITFENLGNTHINEDAILIKYPQKYPLDKKDFLWNKNENRDENTILIDLESALLFDTPIINIENSFIKGNFTISLDMHGIIDINKTCTLIIGNIRAKGIEVNGSSLFAGLLLTGCFDLSNSIFRQNVEFAYNWGVIQSRIANKGYLEMMNCNVFGNIGLSYAEIEGGISLYSAHIETNVVLNQLKTFDTIDIRFSVIKGGLYVFQKYDQNPDRNTPQIPNRGQLHVGGDLRLSASNIKTVSLEGIYVEGIIEVLTGTFESFKIAIGRNSSAPNHLVQSRAKSMLLEALKIQGSIDLTGIVIQDFDNKREDILKTREALQIRNDYASCVIRACEIGGDLQFFNFKNLVELKIDQKKTENFASRLDWGNLNIEANEIGGSIDLKNLYLNKDGIIFINNNVVKLDVDINNFHSFSLGQFTLDAKSQFNREKTGSESRKIDNKLEVSLIDNLKTECKHLNIQNLQVGGNVWLTGIEVKGDLKGQGIQIKGGMYLTADEKGEPCRADSEGELKYIGRIHGQLNLARAAINSINIGWQNFPLIIDSNADNQNQRIYKKEIQKHTSKLKRKKSRSNNHNIISSRINLEGAELNRLTVLETIPNINLSSTKILNWDLKKQTSSRLNAGVVIMLLSAAACLYILYLETFKSFFFLDPDLQNLERLSVVYLALVFVAFGFTFIPQHEAERYCKAFETMYPFENSVYLEAEKTLRSEAKDSEAHKIYRKMRISGRKEMPGIYWWWDVFQYIFIGYGTRLWILLLIWVGFFLGSTIYLSYPEHYQLTRDAQKLNDSPTEQTKNIEDSSNISKGGSKLGSINLTKINRAGPGHPINKVKTNDSKDSNSHFLPYDKALILGAKYTSAIKLPSEGDYDAAENLQPLMNCVSIICVILLSLFGLSITARLIRGK